MAEIEILEVKVRQPVTCKCGKALTHNSIQTSEERLEIICQGCSSSVMTIEYDIRCSNWSCAR